MPSRVPSAPGAISKLSSCTATASAAIDALTAQTSTTEGVVAALDLATLDFEGSDGLDNPEAVFEQAHSRRSLPSPAARQTGAAPR